MEEPRSRIVGDEPDCDVISDVANTYDISDNRVDEVVGRVTRAAYHMEIMPVQMNRVLLMDNGPQFDYIRSEARGHLQANQRHHQEWSAQRSCSH